jgi:prolyl oligopeptidase
MRRVILSALTLVCGCTASTPQTHNTSGAAIAYPTTRRVDQVDVYHGVQVADPYRWLEDLDSDRTKEWVKAQNTISKPYLESIPARERIKQRLTQLWNYERFDVPVKRGGRYFYLRNDGLQNQSVLYVTNSLDSPPRVLLDPNTLSPDATISLGEFVPSPDGKVLAYSLSDGGSDWRTWHFREIDSGRDLPDVLRFIKFSDVAWTADSKSVYYTRYPLRADGTGDDSKQRVMYRHILGSESAADALIYTVTEHPTANPYASISDDGRYLFILLYNGSQSNALYYRTLGKDGSPDSPLIKLVDNFDSAYEVVGEYKDVFYVHTTAQAPNGRVLAIPAGELDSSKWPVSIPESEHAMVAATVVGHRIISQYLQDAHSVVAVSSLQGDRQYEVRLPGLGNADGFTGEVDDTETFFSYTDFLTPASVSKLDISDGTVSVFRAPTVSFDATKYVTEQVFFKSKDGTRVPMFITHRRDAPRDGSSPLMLYGYGGFNIPQLPGFSVPTAVWLEMGGTFALANLRGGSEYGETWHRAGTKLQKQNVFDDFISAAEYLVAEKYTSKEKLSIRGRSNGGLLVGAAITQRPELFGAALPAVGVLDMLRYHTASGNARQWSADYGLSENADEFKALYAYSPLHNVKAGTCYPPTLITTADHDDRVVPWHSFKFAATMQHAQGCANPILLRVETRAGHGLGKPVWMQIEDWADQWGFLVKALRMQLE